jgi:hypothetical protein
MRDFHVHEVLSDQEANTALIYWTWQTTPHSEPLRRRRWGWYISGGVDGSSLRDWQGQRPAIDRSSTTPSPDVIRKIVSGAARTRK